MRKQSEAQKPRCEHCRDELENGDRTICVEDSVVGRIGFVPLPDREDWKLFCCERHFIEHHMPGELNGRAGASLQPPTGISSTRDQVICDNCGGILPYGARALRVQDGNVDGVGFVQLRNRDDWFFFCSKACADYFLSETNPHGIDLYRRAENKTELDDTPADSARTGLAQKLWHMSPSEFWEHVQRQATKRKPFDPNKERE